MDFYLAVIYAVSYLGIYVAVFYALSMLANRKARTTHPQTYQKVSIIIPAYNEEPSISRTIESALALDYPSDKLQIIVVDDGSRDKTYSLAKMYANHGVEVYTKLNGGKGSAINYGLAHALGEIVFTMDADTFVQPDCLKKLVPLFSEPNVMAVTPSMAIYGGPKTIWQRIQQVEYALGTYLRKAFSTVNVIHVTPGAFSGYRRSFFTRYGGFDEHNITEDTEIALRIQSHDFIIENEPSAVIYTLSPEHFGELLAQRRRWYTGLLKNLWTYKRLFGFKRGLVGFFSLPLALLTIFTSIFLSSYFLIKTFSSLRRELAYLISINFQFLGFFDFNLYVIRYFVLSLLSYRLFLFSLLFITIIGLYVHYSHRHISRFKTSPLSFLIFILFYGLIFAFWWAVSLFYTVMNRQVVWRTTKHGRET